MDLSRRSHRLAAIGAAPESGGHPSGGPRPRRPRRACRIGCLLAVEQPELQRADRDPITGRADQHSPNSTDSPIGIKRADSRCTAGSTDPKQAFDNDLNTAWMCVPAYGVPGTVLRVEFDNWYVVTGVSIVPGWNRVNPDGSDEWVKHKTAATVEYQFNDPEETRFTQKTNNIRDEVFTAVQPPVLASAMTITITEFGSPPGPLPRSPTPPDRAASSPPTPRSPAT